MAEQAPYQRMLDWCAQTAKADQGPIVQGRRTIRRVPTAPIEKRREGRIDAAGHAHRVWRGGTTGEVVDSMNADLGAADDQAYHVEE
jgi:hypothetical protein